MVTFQSDWIEVETGTSVNVTIPSGIAVNWLKGKWKGKTTSTQQQQSGSTASSGSEASGNGGASTSYKFPKVSSPYYCSSVHIQMYVWNNGPSGGNVTVNGSSVGYLMAGQGATITNGNFACSYQNQTVSISGTITGGNNLTVGVGGYINYYYYATVYLHTNNPRFYINPDTSPYAQYAGELADGVECAYQTFPDPSKFIPGQTNQLVQVIEESQQGWFMFQFDYDYLRPTPLKILTYPHPTKGLVDVPLVAVDDPCLEYGDCIRTNVDGTIYCADLVDPDDVEASGFSFMTHKGLLRWRKHMTT